MSRIKQLLLSIFLLCSFSQLIFAQEIRNDDFFDTLEKIINNKSAAVNHHSKCKSFEFKCKDNSKCIRKENFCNRVVDCADGSDEYPDCVNEKICQSYEFHCRNGYCVSNSQLCDGSDDCQDNSDENSCEANHCVKNAHLCDQLCIVNGTSYECQCKDGYELQPDKKSCKVSEAYGESVILYSAKEAIKAVNFPSMNTTQLASNLTEVVAIGMDALHVYWADWDKEYSENIIFRSLLNTNEVETFVMNGIGYVEEIAIDWITNNIYYIDSMKKIFGACSSNGQYCTAILRGDHLYPCSLALYPDDGEMFWSEWSGSVIGFIGKSKMNGDGRSAFIKYNIIHPTAITIDYPKKRLYWVDVALGQIESVNLDGTTRHKIMPTTDMIIHSIAIIEDRLYWSDYRAGTINSCNKFNGADKKLLLNETGRITTMQIHHPLLKSDTQNPCKLSNCSELCLLTGYNKYKCACAMDKELSEDGHTCQTRSDKQYLIAATNTFYLNYYGEYIGHPRLFNFHESFPHFTAVAYDSINHGIYLNDKESSSILYYDLHRKKLRIIEDIKNQQVSGMSFDYISNTLYWSNPAMKSIEIYNIQNKQHKSWRFADTPVNILVIPEYGTMVVAFCLFKCRLDKYTMTGRYVENLIAENEIHGPTVSLAYDHTENEIIWADEGTGNVESIISGNKNRRRLHTGLIGPVSIAILNDRMYWTIRDEMTIFTSKTKPTKTGYMPVDHTKLLNTHNNSVLHLVTTNDNKNKIIHECTSLSNGYCSHICLIGYVEDYECACPNGLVLSDNKRDCEVPAPCEGNVYKCLDNSCIDLSKKCDGIIDCLDRDDEANCQKKNTTCFRDEFQCENGKCLSKDNVCNGEDDCGDLTDELNCPFRKCPDSTDFKCKSPSGYCIPQSWQCDGTNDCEDGSDEAICEDKCPLNMKKCDNGVCIETGLTCNKIDDCGDNSDEFACSDHMNLLKPTEHCNIDEYRCIGSNKCVPINAWCNKNRDCPNGDDEDLCFGCEPHQFLCSNSRCVQEDRVCDGKNDCGDNSDEEFCDKQKRMRGSINLYSKTPVTKLEKNETKYMCDSGQLLYYSQVCDGEKNCKDGSDEGGSCDITCTSELCDHHCEETPRGTQCLCMPGYKLLEDGKTCVNIDECTLDGMCSQICLDTEGKYRCDCIAGFRLKPDGRTCKINDNTTIIFTATRHDIREISENFQIINVISRTSSSISGMDINVKEKSLYWSDEKSGTITEYRWDNKKQRIIIKHGKPNLIAVDWVTNNIYFVNNIKPSAIMACTQDNYRCSFIVRLKDEGNVTALAVDPINGFIFWAQVNLSPNGNPSSKIYRSDMDGENVMIIASNKIGLVSGVAVHHTRSQLFWIDRSQMLIEKSKLNGSDRSIFRRVEQPLTINIYEDSIYWLMGSTRTLFSCPLYDSIPCQPVPLQPSNVENFLVISHITSQPYAMNHCANMNCNWMCANKNDSAKCICLDGRILSPDAPNCPFIPNNTDISNNTDPNNTDSNVPANKKGTDESFAISWNGLFLMIIIITPFFIVLVIIVIFYHFKDPIARHFDWNQTPISYCSVQFRNTSPIPHRISDSSSDDNHPMFPIGKVENVPLEAPEFELQERPTSNTAT